MNNLSILKSRAEEAGHESLAPSPQYRDNRVTERRAKLHDHKNLTNDWQR